MQGTGKKPLGEILLESGRVSREDIEGALKKQKMQLGQILIEMGKVTKDEVESALDLQSLPEPLSVRYRRWLRLALAALAVVVLVGSYGLYQHAARVRSEGLLDSGRLTAPQILRFLRAGTAGQRTDALRSVPGLKNADEKTFVLRQALKDRTWTVRLVALSTAKNLEIDGLIPELIPLLLDTNGILRRETHRALVALTGVDHGTSYPDWFRWAKGKGLEVAQPKDLVPG